MKRMSVLLRQRRLQLLAVAALLLLAASVVLGSGAAFTATTSNVASFTAGNLHHTNAANGGAAVPSDGAAAAVLTMTKMKPGDFKAGDVVIANDGDLDGNFQLTVGGLVAGSPDITSQMTIVITETAPVAKAIYNGAINTMPAQTLDPILAGSSATYHFVATFAAGAGNAYKGGSMSATYTWTES
jgi:spore coat-associated protein N